MRYFYQKPDIEVKVFGEPIHLKHPIYESGTLYLENGKGLIVTQKHFDPERKTCYHLYFKKFLEVFYQECF